MNFLCRYFSCETGFGQLDWLLDGDAQIQSLDEVKSLIKINFADFNSKVALFVDKKSIEAYGRLAESIDMFYPYPISCNALVANLLLYVSDEFMILDEPHRIGSIFNYAKKLVHAGHKMVDTSNERQTTFDTSALVDGLVKMRDLFGTGRSPVQDRSKTSSKVRLFSPPCSHTSLLYRCFASQMALLGFYNDSNLFSSLCQVLML